ncbi:hypothetical protein ACP4OV_009875 [Aristida adscensionis]
MAAGELGPVAAGRPPRRRHRRRRISATSSRGECVDLEQPPGKMASKKKKMASKKRKRKAISPAPELPDEIVAQILVRLPVKSLLRFKSVCKAWRATISDPFFTRAHLRSSAARSEQDPAFLIYPHTLYRVIEEEAWPTTFSSEIRLYQWRPGDTTATVLHGGDFGGEFSMVFWLAHCDGLVLVPTDTKLYLFNPATRDAVALPASSRYDNGVQEEHVCWHTMGCRYIDLDREVYYSASGLGQDPRTGEYKVVRSFYHSCDIGMNICHMGMEVFTVGGSAGGDGWREIAPGPPHLVSRWETPVTVKGFMFWHMDNRHKDYQPAHPRGILRLSLDDEAFAIAELPASLDPALDDEFTMGELRGELCLTARTSKTQTQCLFETVNIWAMTPTTVAMDSRWEVRYSITLCFPWFHPMALLPSGDAIVLRNGSTLYRYDLRSFEMTALCEAGQLSYQGRKPRTWRHLHQFDMCLYTESLVRLTPID